MALPLPENVADCFKIKMREARISLNMSQDELAQRVGSTKQVISTYETGSRIPKVPMAVSIASALDTSLDWLCGFSTKIEPTAIDSCGLKGDPIDEQLAKMVSHLTPDQKKLFLTQLTMLEGNKPL